MDISPRLMYLAHRNVQGNIYMLGVMTYFGRVGNNILRNTIQLELAGLYHHNNVQQDKLYNLIYS